MHNLSTPETPGPGAAAPGTPSTVRSAGDPSMSNTDSNPNDYRLQTQ